MTIFGLNAVVTTIMHSTENKFEEYGKMCRLQHNVLSTLDILFLSNHNIHNSSYGLCFWSSDPLIDVFY